MRKTSTLIKKDNCFQAKWDKKSVKEFNEDWIKGIEVEWYASTKDKDRGNDIVEPEAFKSAIDSYMKNPIVLLQHDMDKPIWKVVEANIDDNWLYIKAQITEDVDWVMSAIKNDVLKGFSIGFRIKDYEFVENELWDGSYDYVNIIKDLELFEISVVSVPMNAYALMKSMADCFEIKDVEEAVESNEQESEEIAHEEETWAENDEIPTSGNHSEEEKVVEEEKSEDSEETTEEVVEETKEIEAETPVETVAESESEATEEAEVEDTPVEEKTEESEPTEETKSVDDHPVDKQPEDDEEDDEEETQADENSEIEETQSESDQSENVAETATDSEPVEKAEKWLKDLQRKSVEQFISNEMKAIDEKVQKNLAEKDARIKELEWKLEKTLSLLWDTIAVLKQIDSAVTNTVVQTWFKYQAPERKGNSTRYTSLVEKIQNI